MSKGAREANGKASVVVLTADAEFEQLARETFGSASELELRLLAGPLSRAVEAPEIEGGSVLIVDIESAAQDGRAMVALERLIARLNGASPVVVVVRSITEAVARLLIQIRVSDFLVKPVASIDLVRACAKATQTPAEKRPLEAEIYTFLPAAGGVGVTTLAIQTAMQLMKSGTRASAATCLVDLDFQQGACADYLDIEPRLDLNEIEPRPERLDRHLLEVMLSRHASGLSVIAAPNRPAEMRSFDPDMVTRLLDLVSTHFEYVVIDMPRTWFSWTDSVLLGTNKLYIVTEMTVPGLRHAKQLVTAIGERLGEGPKPKVIVNRFEQRLFDTGLRRADIEQALGGAFIGTIPNNYRLVREAIDRGVPLDEVKPGNNVSGALKKLISLSAAAPAGSEPVTQARSLAWTR